MTRAARHRRRRSVEVALRESEARLLTGPPLLAMTIPQKRYPFRHIFEVEERDLHMNQMALTSTMRKLFATSDNLDITPLLPPPKNELGAPFRLNFQTSHSSQEFAATGCVCVLVSVKSSHLLSPKHLYVCGIYPLWL